MTLGLLALLSTLFWGFDSHTSPPPPPSPSSFDAIVALPPPPLPSPSDFDAIIALPPPPPPPPSPLGFDAIVALPPPSPSAFDAIVALDGSGNFMSITEALQAAPNNSERRYNIQIKEGIYNEYIFIHKNKTNITFIGEGMDRTIITGCKSNGTGFKTNETATVDIHGHGFIAQDITIQNSARASMHQAVAASISADRVVFYRCKFDGYQDTLYTKKGVQFFKDCEVYGTVDFIFGNAKVILQNCTIYVRKPEDIQNEVTITAQGRKHKHEDTAIVLQGCTINVEQDLREREPKVRVFLGRSWKNHSRAIVMSSFLDEFIDPEGWLEWNGNIEDIYFGEYNNNGPGANLDGRVHWLKILSDYDASNFTVRNFLHGHEWIPSEIPTVLDLL